MFCCSVNVVVSAGDMVLLDVKTGKTWGTFATQKVRKKPAVNEAMTALVGKSAAPLMVYVRSGSIDLAKSLRDTNLDWSIVDAKIDFT